MKLPGPDHPITIAATASACVSRSPAVSMADTRHALTLKEAGYKPVFYVPRADADMALLAPTRSPPCPYKGDASYFTITVDGRSAENAVWSYEQPYPAMAEIKEHLAFYPDRVDKIEEI